MHSPCSLDSLAEKLPGTAGKTLRRSEFADMMQQLIDAAPDIMKNAAKPTTPGDYNILKGIFAEGTKSDVERPGPGNGVNIMAAVCTIDGEGRRMVRAVASDPTGGEW